MPATKNCGEVNKMIQSRLILHLYSPSFASSITFFHAEMTSNKRVEK